MVDIVLDEKYSLYNKLFKILMNLTSEGMFGTN